MLQSGLFDLQDRFGKLDQLGDPLKALNAVVDWSVFEPILTKGLQNRVRRSSIMRNGTSKSPLRFRTGALVLLRSPRPPRGWETPQWLTPREARLPRALRLGALHLPWLIG